MEHWTLCFFALLICSVWIKFYDPHHIRTGSTWIEYESSTLIDDSKGSKICKLKKLILEFIEKFGKWTKSGPLSAFISKVLLEHNHNHLFTYCLGYISVMIVGLSDCNRDHMTYKPKLFITWLFKEKDCHLWCRITWVSWASRSVTILDKSGHKILRS
jgi:hypothetical protein